MTADREQERTLAVTWGSYGGFYTKGRLGDTAWRICLGWLAITYLEAEFTEAMWAWLDALDAKEAIRGR